MSKRWLKIPLVVAAAFALTMSVDVINRSAHDRSAMPSLWTVALMSPGFLPTDLIRARLSMYLLLSFDVHIDQLVLMRWLNIAFNTLFYSGLFWLLSMFIS